MERDPAMEDRAGKNPRRKRLKGRIYLLVLSLVLCGGFAVAGYWNFPPLLPPAQYGNVLINRLSGQNGQLPVSFSHTIHRQKYTCRVCHFELGFEMKAGATKVTEAENRAGEYCGCCHNEKIAFGHTKQENCPKCHNGDISKGEAAYEKLALFPHTLYGRIDWSEAIKTKLISPKQSILEEKYSPTPFDKKLTLEAEWTYVPPAYFPHEEHNLWLDCGNCHPDIFNIKKKTTKHFEMKYLLDGLFCGVCHLKVAFPINDCKRCHPQMK